MEALPTTAALADWVKALTGQEPADQVADLSDAERVDRIRLFEELKAAAAAAQAREAVALRRSRELAAREAGASARDAAAAGAAVAAEVALARRESPRRGSMLMGLAVALTDELPHTMAALTRGEISEWRAMLVCRETACLTRADRARVDALLKDAWTGLSDRQLVARAREHAYQLDPHAFVARSAQAVTDRHVSIRPAPDTMAWVSALLPVAQGVAVYASLNRVADGARASGDARSRGQVMADTLVEHVTGQTAADQTPVEVQLVITDRALLADGTAPARVPGYGPIPAEIARQLLTGLDEATGLWIRRLYQHPGTGRLVAMESSRRVFPTGMRRFLAVRDQTCRTPWCGAPVRHADHVVPVREGGPTSLANGQGLCERCNQAKETPGWRSRTGPEGSITLTTPSGHQYLSHPPPLPQEGAVFLVDIVWQTPALPVDLTDAA